MQQTRLVSLALDCCQRLELYSLQTGVRGDIQARHKPLGSHGSEQASPLLGRDDGRGGAMSICRLLKTQGLYFSGTWGLEPGWSSSGSGSRAHGLLGTSSSQHLGKLSTDCD